MNIEFKGTQGEWKAGDWLDNEFSVMVDGPSLARICRMDYVIKTGLEPNEEMEANAALLATAPKLLDALRRILDLNCPLTGNPTRAELIEHWGYEQSQGNGAAEDNLLALAVIAEALGEQP